ncbi:restriction endonuclease subunit S [Rhodococcus sp. NPDC057014]|uniref:restriction endonuclease subunit S n=1 Tax=Rhodococcus sp. NPDC057014 TaxID=3346000 RepID=UPI003642EC48
MNWPTYPKYQQSKNDVLGEIPATWVTTRLKMLLTEPMSYGANAAADDNTPDNPRYVRITDIGADGNLRPDTFRSLPPEVAAPYLLSDGDVLFARSGATVGKTFMYVPSWGRCCYAGYLIRARVNRSKLLPEYLNYFTMTTSYWQHIFSEQIQATIQNVSAERYGSLPVPVPPLSVQHSIIDFLNIETNKIDALIAKQEQLITTLREDRTATVAHAVTKGLDHHAEMTDSGVEWIGLIPSHWTLPQLGMHSVVGNGATPSRENLNYWTNGTVPWLNSSHVNRAEITDSDQFVTELARTSCHLPVVPAGSVLIGLTGQGKTRGMASLLKFESTINQHIAFVTPTSSKINPRFLREVLHSAYQVLRDLSEENGSTKGGLTCGAIRKLPVPVPPVTEQSEILNFLETRCGKIDALIDKANQMIRTLREYRSALITDAVTGKIDVRGAA